MRILVLSDNHYKDIDFDFKDYDYIIHCGDYGKCYDKLKDTLFVKGNCDTEGIKELIEYVNDKKIYITHGDLYNVKMSYNSIIYQSMSIESKITFFGHTHIPTFFESDNILFINPGSYCDGYYVIIDDNNISYYKEGKVIKKISFRW